MDSIFILFLGGKCSYQLSLCFTSIHFVFIEEKEAKITGNL